MSKEKSPVVDMIKKMRKQRASNKRDLGSPKRPDFEITEDYDPKQHISLRNLRTMWGISKNETIYRRLNEGWMPMPVAQYGQAPAWRIEDIEEICDDRNPSRRPDWLVHHGTSDLPAIPYDVRWKHALEDLKKAKAEIQEMKDWRSQLANRYTSIVNNPREYANDTMRQTNQQLLDRQKIHRNTISRLEEELKQTQSKLARSEKLAGTLSPDKATEILYGMADLLGLTLECYKCTDLESQLKDSQSKLAALEAKIKFYSDTFTKFEDLFGEDA